MTVTRDWLADARTAPTTLRRLREHLDEAYMNTAPVQVRAREELWAAIKIVCAMQHERGEVPARCDCREGRPG